MLGLMTSNIILIGFMGCGKSSIGRRLALRLDHQFLDSDELISARAGMSVTEIFEAEGEENFRKRETEELKHLIGSNGIILATGGGAILNPVNRDTLRHLGIILWLHAEPEVLFERTSRNRKRPLLQVENPRSTFFRLLDSRLPLYQGMADFTVDATGLSHEQTVEACLKQIALVEKKPPFDAESDDFH